MEGTGSASQALPFRCALRLDTPWPRSLSALFEKALERALAFPRLNRMYAEVTGPADDRSFFEKSLERLGIGYRVSDLDLARIPRRGPTVVVANHPFGGLEGLILADLLLKIRPDAKIMANYLLERIPELRDHLIFVDPFGGREAALKNLRGLREAIAWLRQGGLLGVFPAGEVAHWHFKEKTVTDPEWKEMIAGLIRKTGSAVTPVYFEGQNRTRFHLLGLIHPRLRTALLPHELLNKMHTRIDLRIGQPLPFKKIERFAEDRSLIDYLRQRTYLLGRRLPVRSVAEGAPPAKRRRKWKPLVVPTVTNFLLEEVRNLPEGQVLLEQEEYQVFWARAAQIPYTLREIGRLRELTFREAGEGTGDAIDLDGFDTHYQHLVLWQKKGQEVVGAYRMGPTDQILSTWGKEGLYTHSLFKFHHDFFLRVHPALELGRSFIRREYQKAYSTLMLLWKGIGQYVVRYPRYRFLFGPVSISDDYRPVSRILMVKFLQEQNYWPELASLVKARRPYRTMIRRDWLDQAVVSLIRDAAEVSDWIAELEADQKGIPILLKQYLKLGGKLLGFNIDPQFSHVVDGLILVDLVQTSPAVLEKYLGKAGADRFLGYHKAPEPATFPTSNAAAPNL
jgi:putative hemolysin